MLGCLFVVAIVGLIKKKIVVKYTEQNFPVTFFFFLARPLTFCEMLVPQPGMETVPSAVVLQILTAGLPGNFPS